MYADLDGFTMKNFDWYRTHDQLTLPTDVDDTEKLRGLLGSSAYLEEAGQDPVEWLIAILKSPLMQGAVFLLTLMQNVKEVKLPDVWLQIARRDKVPIMQNLCMVFKLIPEKASRRSRDDDGVAALAELEKLVPNAVYGRRRYHPTNALDTLAPFIAINSVRRWVGEGLLTDRIACNPIFPDLSFNPEHIELYACLVDTDACYDFVSRMPRLRTFKYNHH